MTPATRHRMLVEWSDGDIAPADSATLLAAARSDPDLRRELAMMRRIERLLRHHGATSGIADAFADEVIERLRSTDMDGRLFCSRIIARIGRDVSAGGRRHFDLDWMRRWGSWAAVFLVTLGLIAFFGRALASRPKLATLVGAEAVRWTKGQTPLMDGQGLSEGRIRLDAGFLRVRFESGASVLLEGPAELELIDRNKARLHRGRAVAEVPPTAIGFMIESPDGQVVDLGTRFGIDVGIRGGGTEVHVLEGLVRALVPGEAVGRNLRESQALRISGRATSAIAADGARFLTRLPPKGEAPVSYIHWGLDEGSGATAKADGPLAQKATARLSSLLSGDPGPEWVPGRFGRALDFDGADDFVATDFWGISGGHARTVATWAKVPTDWDPINGFALISWGSMRSPGSAWQISINPLPKDGPLGRLRAGVHSSQVIGTHDLRDGMWHHLAAVLFDGVGPRNTTHILLYVDGELEPAERKGIQEVNTQAGSADALKVSLGRNMDAHPTGGGRVFRGALDEVFIFDSALTRDAIQRLMRQNAPPESEPESRLYDKSKLH